MKTIIPVCAPGCMSRLLWRALMHNPMNQVRGDWIDKRVVWGGGGLAKITFLIFSTNLRC